MFLSPLWQFLEGAVFTHPSSPLLFNLYRDADARFDRPGAASIRRTNLKSYLSSFTRRPPILLVGEAPGPRGCRFSGVPFTSEHQLVNGLLNHAGKQSSNREMPFVEASATTVRSALAGHESRVFVWNCVPFHPHKIDEPLSIRSPSIAEIRRYAPILRGVIEVLRPRQIVAIGRKAAQTLEELKIAAEQVRHPSHGGAGEFQSRMRQILAIKLSRARSEALRAE